MTTLKTAARETTVSLAKQNNLDVVGTAIPNIKRMDKTMLNKSTAYQTKQLSAVAILLYRF